MTARTETTRARTPRRGRDRGFTLIELVIATVLSGIIAGVIIAALATSLRVASSTTNQIADSTDTALISTFLFRDAQAAGATDPATARVDTSLGVSTSNTSSGWAGCPQAGQLVLRFSWIDRQADSLDTKMVVTYALDNGLLTRRECQGDAGVDVVLGNDIAAADAECRARPASDADAPSCDGLPESVSLTFSGSASANPFEYTLRASLRPGVQTPPTIAGSSVVPLVVLGGAVGTMPCPVVSVNKSTVVTVVGDAVIGAECGAAPVGGTPGKLVHPHGATRTLTGLTDPFAGLVAPASACDENALTQVGENVTLHPEHVVNPMDELTGVHVFCNGLELQDGADLEGTDVFLYILGGTLTVDPGATVSLTASASGPHANMLVSVRTSQQVTIGGDSISRYLGHIHAPTSDIIITGAAPTMLGGVVAETIEFAGGPVRLGLPVPELEIAATTIPSGQVGLAYSTTPTTTFTADGGQPTYTWRASGLPDGIVLDDESGELSGEPTEPGTYDAVVTVLDNTSAAETLNISISISAAPSIAGPDQLPSGQVAVQYPTTLLEAAGGTSPFTWTSTAMPQGLVLDPETGEVSGAPTAAGSFSVTFTATDARSATVSREYTVDVREQLTVATPALPGGQVGVAYPKIALTVAGGTPPAIWTAEGLPPGLGVSLAGELAGTPTTPGTYNVVVQATDAFPAEATTAYAVTIAPVLGVGTTSLPGGQVGVGYPETSVLATGGTPPFVWSATGLPEGLTIDSGTGTVAGTPTVAGTSTVAAEVTDANGATSAASYSIVIDAALAIAGPATLPGGQVGLAYPSTPVSRSGGTLSYSWSATGLPPGLTINAATGIISGSPTAPGAFTVDVTVTDALSVTAARRYGIAVVAAPSITTATLPNGQLNVAYPATTLVAAGGQVPRTWSASGLPTGLTIAPTTGVITGTPLAAGVSTVVVGVTDAVGATATRSLSLTVTAPAWACPAAVSGWRAEYFANMSLTGDPKFCRDDASINFNWGSGSPGTGIANDNFSARWTQTREFAAGTYTFAIGSDDGSRLYIDGVLVFNRWVDQGYPSTVPTVKQVLTDGDHLIVMEYYERGGSARATLTWTFQPPPDPCAADFSGSWKGEYFTNATLTGPPKCRSDASIDFNWGSGLPMPSIPADQFSARWTRVESFAAGTYRFALGSDDGSRLYIDGELVLNQWGDQSYPNPVPTKDHTLRAGSHTIVVEYYENSGDARAKLEWTSRANGVTATPSVSGKSKEYRRHQIEVKNTSEFTAMTVTIVVDRTDNWPDFEMWSDFDEHVIRTSTNVDGSMIYTFDLRSNRIVLPGTRVLIVQTNGKSTLQPTSGDTWTVVTTSRAGVTNELTGTF